MNDAAGLTEVRVPDMGSFKDVAVIDVLVNPGDSVAVDTPLVTLESEKATYGRAVHRRRGRRESAHRQGRHGQYRRPHRHRAQRRCRRGRAGR